MHKDSEWLLWSELHFEETAGHLGSDIWKVDADCAEEHNIWVDPSIEMTVAIILLPQDWGNMKQDD